MRGLIQCFVLVLTASLGTGSARAQPDKGQGRAVAEHALQNYLGMWAQDAGVTAAAVDRFYAPSVVYYGKRFSRADVLADKRSFIQAYPVRNYREIPGTFVGRCNADRSLCHVSAEMAYRRFNRRNVLSTGRVRLGFDFVPVEGARKIVRESARLL